MLRGPLTRALVEPVFLDVTAGSKDSIRSGWIGMDDFDFALYRNEVIRRTWCVGWADDFAEHN